MIRPDLLTCWPWAHDYPLWRAQVARDAARFGKVIIVFTSDNIPFDTRAFVRESLPFATFVEATPNASDWYDDALRTGLSVSTAEWVWFTEEDFFYPEEFLDSLLGTAGDYDMVCVDDGRTDPSCCLVRRSVLDQNDVGFQHHPDVLDNFDAFSLEVKKTARWTTPDALGLVGQYHHMRGLSHNHYLAYADSPVTYEPEEFADYLRACLACGVVLDPAWQREAESYLLRCGT